MGMGYSACSSTIIKQDFVEETCPEKFEALIQAIVEDDTNLDTFAQAVGPYLNFHEPVSKDMPDVEDVTQKIWNAFIALTEEFEQKTGLVLRIGYHNQQEEGDRYDDVNGTFWPVGNVYQYTPAGEKYKDKIETVNFVEFG